MNRPPLRIVSRNSPLALWQSGHVRQRLLELHPELAIEIVGITTQADRFTDRSLAELGGKGLFVKELDEALRDGRADIAVHSMKDVPAQIPDGLELAVVLPRADPRDVFIAAAPARLEDLPPGARVGTSSLRRRCQLLHRRPDLRVLEMRGNVGTRLDKLARGECDALILAAAGILRLGLEARIEEYLPAGVMLPAPGQGALGVECRTGDRRVQDLIRPLNDSDAWQCVAAERAVTLHLHGDCHTPIAGLATIRDGTLRLEALVGRTDGSLIIHDELHGEATRGVEIGAALAGRLLERGAAGILAEFEAGGQA